ncbi:MAG TPA: hypothetical protein VK702_01540 [Candidatus Acidoferrum sp.]|jgi:hypothetical protein|nr:hypothetical protein [Candidatus Acidoferrum sp.]
MSADANTIRVIYEMRYAAERKARAELKESMSHTRETAGALLDASLELEAKTQDAIDHCASNNCSDPTHAHGATVTDINARKRAGTD